MANNKRANFTGGVEDREEKFSWAINGGGVKNDRGPNSNLL